MTKKLYRVEDLGNGWALTIWPPMRGRSWTIYEVSKCDDRGYVVDGLSGEFCRRRDATAFFRDHQRQAGS